ncbi:MAG: NADH-ubiquinone oxidoreductase-F iron-sulfur binding region domain-containing protein [Gallionella sp.]|nr:NADH-ubiquinone oxidoreductase-F iron-sulfur binding region domain-containing protein [Gallionella sp.]
METLNRNLLHPQQRVGENMPRWLQAGGSEALRGAVKDTSALLPAIKEADLRGLGGSGFPVWRKWEAVAKEAASPDKYLVCNGNEDEPGTFKDRLLLEETPHQIIEGALLGALACGINRIVFYINPDLTRSLAALKSALGQWQDGELLKLASDALGKQIKMELVPGSSHYIGGEETAAMEWIEGQLSGKAKFPFPRGKPPYPAQCGIFGCPTLINNIETLAHVPAIMRNGAEWFRNLGIGHGAGTKLYSLSGDVLHPGVYELPMGTTLRDLIYVHGGGLLSGKPLKAVFTGGPSNTLLTPDDLDVNMDFESLRERGASLGTGAMIVVSEGTGMVKRVAEYARFFAHSSCGQCPPCKTGTATISRLLDRIDTGCGTAADMATLESLCRMLPGSGRCHLVNGVAQLLDSSFRHFRNEYEQALK